MTTLVIKNTFAPGETVSAERVSENFSKQTDLGDADTLSDVLNGGLEQENYPFQVDADLIQPFALVQGHAVGGSNSLDYFSEVFGKSIMDAQGVQAVQALVAKPTGPWVSVPGLGQRVYVPTDNATLYIMWSIDWTNDGIYWSDNNPTRPPNWEQAPGASDIGTKKDQASAFQLFVDDEQIPGMRRVLPGTVVEDYRFNPPALAKNEYSNFYAHGDVQQVWTGCLPVQGVAKGWHTVSLRLQAHYRIKQTRVRSRNLRVIVFR